ncbi:MAG TPA: D-cysteine desulfhydrase family protein [Patescibacteria group bacterium]|jgi:D-cysteine desulfhydrase|nr:D-cysteine desulfhydrase family protein [Patescibacteria group bacterium]
MATSAPPIPRIELAQVPTPLLKLERLSAELGLELWLKRDDFTGLLETGNKIRKLEFLVGDALAHGADTLITCGTLQSNCCRAVAAVSARLGLRAVLALKGDRPSEYDGNLLLDQLLGATIRYCTDTEWDKVDEVLEDMAARERAAGHKPYVIPESGATAVGALGYLACGQEIAQQIRHGAPDFDSIVITAFSGGSQAGLLMAKQLTGLRAEILSVPIAWEGPRVQAYVSETIETARRRWGLAVNVPAEVRLLDGYQGVGRAEVRKEEFDVLLRLARLEGIVLDPVYTAKAFGGLLDFLNRYPGRLGRRVCFIHTGGVFSVFPFRDSLSRLVDV